MLKKLLLSSLLMASLTTSAQTVIFSEDFETEMGRNSWINTDRDGDSQKWEFDNSSVDAFTGYYATSWSWYFEAFTPDNTLTSPVITLPNNSGKKLNLKFDVGAFDDAVFQEHYAVYVIPANSTFTGTETAVFEETLDAGYMDEAKHVTVDISEFAGQDVQVVFRHYDCTDLLVLIIDNIQVLETETLAVSDFDKSNLQVYPNPSSDFIKIKGVDNIQKIRLYDVSGKMVLETQSTEADIRRLPAGQYILNVHSGSEIISKKVIKK
ncbi:choice-of-anchor J domain-containing protein [Chryseobacterium sp. KACC 21268]|nr:choice-of-anchor J domain-containing protein [Chryseobacterium sp. KACC 21268]